MSSIENLYIKPSKEEEELIWNDVLMDEEQLLQKTECIKNWIQSKPYLPQSIRDEDIISFLMWAKGDIEESEKRIDIFFTMRTYESFLLGLRDPLEDTIRDTYLSSYVAALPRQYNGCTVVIAGPSTSDTSLFTPEGCFRRGMLIVETVMKMRPINSGFYIILDQKFANIRHVLKVSPTVARRCALSIQNVYPCRIKKIISINTNSLARIAIHSLIFPLVKEKLKKRIHIYSEGGQVLSNHFPIEILPKDYGGNEMSLQELNDATNSLLLSRREVILEDTSLKTDESLRDGKDPYSQSRSCSVM